MQSTIQPVPAFNGPAVSLRVDDGHVSLGQGAHFQWALLNANDEIVAGPARSPLTDEQYNAWTGDDQYVVDSVAANLGVVLAE